MHWYVIALWKKGEADTYSNICDYYIIDEELCFARFDNCKYFHMDGLDGELNIPVNYKPGDILEADLYPFGHKYKFVILEIGDNRDCCCLQALAKKKNGLWDVGAVKHGMIGDMMHYPRISVFYTAHRYEPDMTDPEDAILARVSELTAGDEKRGSILWGQRIYHKTEEELMKHLNSAELLEELENSSDSKARK